MNRILAMALAFAVMGAPSALAQNAPVTGVEDLPDGSDYFMSDDVRDFYADDTRSTMRSDEEMKAAFDRMSPEQQERMRAACAADQERSYEAMCRAAM